jgi:hypothetical protein
LFSLSTVSAQIPNPTIDFTILATPEMVGTPNIAVFSADIVPHSEIYNYLSTAVAHVNSLPDEINKGNGQSLLADETATQMMSYAKWLFSPTSAQELLGATLAPIGINLFLLLTLLIFMAIAWTTIKIAVMIFKFVQWIVRWVLEIMPF